MAPSKGYHLIKMKDRAQNAREDTTALLLAKMVQIAEENERPYREMITDLKNTPERMSDVVHSLVGLVVQYAEGAGGYLRLCEYLTAKLVQRQEDQLPGMTSQW